ncbi:MAG: tetratricopeptide repeat protein [Kofleriaceae bacterium]
MRALVVLLALASGVGVPSDVAAQPKKAPPDRFAKAAGDAFKLALAADEQNDLPTALGLYKKAFAISPHPSTAYNIADVFRRQGKLTDAIHFFEIFLALNANARDAKEVESIIAKLWATPAVLELESTPPSDPNSVDLESAYVLVNGEIVKKAGEPAAFDPRTNAPRIELAVPAGPNQTVDVITPLSFGSVRCRLPPGEKQRCTIRMDPRIDGSLVVSSTDDRRDLQLQIEWKKRVMRERVKVPAGKHVFEVRDHSLECPSSATVDVPKGTDVAYVFIDGQPTWFYQKCRAFKIKQHRLKFAN